MKHALAALVVLSASACLTLDEGAEVETGVVARAIDPGASGCPVWGCGANSATVGDGFVFDELDQTGVAANLGGVTIASVNAPDGSPGKLYVSGSQMTVWTYDWRPFYGRSIVNTVIKLRHPTLGFIEVKITNYDDKALRFWAGPPDAVPFYELKARNPVTGQFSDPACHSELTEDPMWVGKPHYAVVFQGDRYDAASKKARDVGDSDPWFNIACAGTSPAKMHLMRHTRASSVAASGASYWTTDKERTALLKMFTADYCGNGHTFTVDGQPLAYQDSAHWKNPMEDYWAIESYWTNTGATCLHKPRYTDLNIIYTVCGRVLPDCPSPTWPTAWEDSAHVFSALRP